MGLTVERLRRMGGAAGVVFVVVAVVGFFLPGTPPKANEVSKITAFFADKHNSILASNFLLGIGFGFFLLFVGALRAHLGAADRANIRPGSAMLAGGVAGASMIFAGTAVLNGAVFQVASAGDANLNHALYDVSSDLLAFAAFGFAAFFAGAAAAGAVTGALPQVLAPAALLLAVLNAVSGVALFAKSGFFAIGGAFGYIVPLASLLWILAASIVMLRPAPAAPAPT
jgi:hypothetical protein